MRVRTSICAAAVALMALLAAGCGGGADDAETTAWADKICGSYVSFRETLTAAVPTTSAPDHAQQVQQLSVFAENVVAAAQEAIAGIDTAGAPDVDGAAAVAATLTQRMTQIQTTFAAAKAQIEAARDQEALAQSIVPLQELAHLPDPTSELTANADLRRAVDAAPSCQRLRASGG
ncbi:hypothetical protein [Pseudonocardia asaccharolytica]|uniref:Lipoprotein n=1 Tax=Pseudonocardia asaccharolytica DSM 44247 = NBRC 16224 TaxID=1123024 RepID=A0A511D3S7_9PSEU|nr:hypothetical protein [Pseudonocardia asaccharolytica]GEL18254.1 hypothetical protein PA7_20910 [Pseudonocardia asaccharolytica DSM 44247 = NBRC 16224]